MTPAGPSVFRRLATPEPGLVGLTPHLRLAREALVGRVRAVDALHALAIAGVADDALAPEARRLVGLGVADLSPSLLARDPMRIASLVLVRDLLGVEVDELVATGAKALSARVAFVVAERGALATGAALFLAGCATAHPAALSWRATGHALASTSIARRLAAPARLLRSPAEMVRVLETLAIVVAAAQAAQEAEPSGSSRLGRLLAREAAAIAHPDGSTPRFWSHVPVPNAGDAAAAFGVGPPSVWSALCGVATREPARRGLVVLSDSGLLASGEGAERLACTASSDGGGPGLELVVDGRLRVEERTRAPHPTGLLRALPASLEVSTLDGVVVARFTGERVRHERLVVHAPGRALAVFERSRSVIAGSDLRLAPHTALEVLDGELHPIAGEAWTLVPRVIGDVALSAWGVVLGEAALRRGPLGTTLLELGAIALRVSCTASGLRWARA